MTERQNIIWQKIEQHQFDDPESSFPFSSRLSRENGWSRAKSLHCLNEYKRFLLLAATAGHPVSPPDVIDQVWHLHLLYTRNYWDTLCKKVIDMNLHHEPSQGGATESAKFKDWYEKTLRSYVETFNQPPPVDIWPARGVGTLQDFKRVDTHACWIIPKFQAIQGIVIALILIAIIAFASGCESVARAETPKTLSTMDNPFDYKGTEFLSFYFTVLGMAILAAFAFRWQAKNSATPLRLDPPLDPIQTGYLRGKESGAVRTAITSLIGSKKLSFDYQTRQFQTQTNPDRNDSLIEQGILRFCQMPQRIGRIEQAVKPHLEEIDAHLSESGYLVPGTNRNISGIGVLLIAGVLITGIIKVIIGISRERPVGFLVLGCFATLVILILFAANAVFRSRAGERYLNELKLKYQNLRSAPKPTMSASPSAAAAPYYDPMPFVLMYALYVNSVLSNDPTMTPLQSTFETSSSSISSGDSSSCSSGDSGGGGGGDSGGGGCGGCGGGGGD